MKRFKHTKRSGFAFVLFGPFTLFILNWVMLAHARKEVNSMHVGRPDYKKSMPFIVAFLLGFITLFVVPLAWLGRLATKIRRLSYEHHVEGKYVSAPWVICWLIFGSFILVGPFVAFMRLFRNLNRLEAKLNAEMDAAAAEGEKPVEAEKPAEAAKPVEAEKPAEAKPEEAKPAAAKEQPIKVIEPVKEEPTEPEVIEVLPPEKRKYRVRMANSKNALRYFETKEEAIAYAKGVAKARKVNVLVKH